MYTIVQVLAHTRAREKYFRKMSTFNRNRLIKMGIEDLIDAGWDNVGFFQHRKTDCSSHRAHVFLLTPLEWNCHQKNWVHQHFGNKNDDDDDHGMMWEVCKLYESSINLIEILEHYWRSMERRGWKEKKRSIDEFEIKITTITVFIPVTRTFANDLNL